MKKFIIAFIFVVLLVSCGVFVYKSIDLTKENFKLKEDIKENINKNFAETPVEIDKRVEGSYPLEKLDSMDISKYNKIMISTHPDDEMYWGGAHLLEDDYLVVCITCGMDDNRQEEFEKMMSITGDAYIMLSYPKSVDLSLVREFNWYAASYVTQDLINILSLKDWDMIVTHNPEGEYGHKYHILTSQIVTSLVKDKEKLYYFEKYYTADNASSYTGPVLSEEMYKKKYNLAYDVYVSQRAAFRAFSHMFNNENFVKYSDWK